MPRLLLVVVLLLSARSASGDDAETFFERKIRPVLAGTCFRCHGGERTGGKLRVDSRAALVKGGDSGPAIVPGAPDESLLIEALRHEGDAEHMPPDKPLPPSVADDFATWVRAGAPWSAAPDASFQHRRHWAFEPLRHAPPPIGGASPIDSFLEVKLREHGLSPAGPADKRTLIRRATFDLTGLPPTPEAVEAFLADDSPAAFDRVVERLLASPRYGERWGRHWLDVARYADTAGETADFPVPQARRYRDYVIAAFNRDLPYDQFIREQLAGDLLARQLPPSDARRDELIVATGYLAVARRFGFDISKDHYLTIEDTIDVLGKSVLGLTVACARCHDHKYDPIAQADYYGFYGVFASTRYPFPGCEKDKKPREFVDHGSESVLAHAVAEGTVQNARIHRRGDPENLGDEVPRRFLPILNGPTVASGGGSGRLELAEWLTRPDHPLTARVMVNRVWQHHFGAGIVKTANDFGTRGSPPSHPELLDYLAGRFSAGGWSVKSLHRLIMQSEAYQRAGDTASVSGDPENTWLGRFSGRRLSAEEIRDAILAISGDLDPAPGGPHPFPKPETWGFTQHAPFSAVYEHDHRSVYLMTQRIKRHPFLALFDGADPNSSTPDRQVTTVPTQALFFLNDPFVHAKAARLAARLTSLPDDPARLDRAFRLCFARGPTPAESETAARFLAAYEANPGQNRAPAWEAWLRVLLTSNEFLYVD